MFLLFVGMDVTNVGEELAFLSDLLLDVYPRWDDLRFPASVVAAGGAAPTKNTTYG